MYEKKDKSTPEQRKMMIFKISPKKYHVQSKCIQLIPVLVKMEEKISQYQPGSF